MSELAIRGGDPVRTRPFPDWPVWDEREREALLGVLESGTWGALDQADSRVRAFERAFAVSHHARYAHCTTNGSAALEAALRSVEVDYGDEVLLPAYTFIASATA